MRFQYTEKKVTLPENVHKYAEKKVMKLERFFGTDADALVTFSVEKNRNNVEITVHAAGTYFRASESTSDMFASIDAAVATIERQIRKNKTRLARRLRQDAFVRTPDETSFAPDEPEEGTFELVRMKKFNMKPMTREEAILQMNLLEHTFFAFRDEDNDGAFAVVYKRTDGGGDPADEPAGPQLLRLPQQRGRQPVHRLPPEERRLRPDRGPGLKDQMLSTDARKGVRF